MKILKLFKWEITYILCSVIFGFFIRRFNAELIALHSSGVSLIELFYWKDYRVLLYAFAFIMFIIFGAILIGGSLGELFDDCSQDQRWVLRIFRFFIVVICMVPLFNLMNVIIFSIIFAGVFWLVSQNKDIL